jgi:hypothetical protein
MAKANDVAEEVLSAIRTVKSFACERFESMRFLSFLNITLGIGAQKALAHVGFLLTTEVRHFFLGICHKFLSSP